VNDTDTITTVVSPSVTKPVCKLIGKDGNVFNIIGLVSQALKRAGQAARAKEFVRQAFAAQSYDAVLGLAMDYVEVK
jgi:hypothetical protein